MLTFRLISSVTYLKQASIYTTRLGNNSEQNQNLCTIINEKQNCYTIKTMVNGLIASELFANIVVDCVI